MSKKLFTKLHFIACLLCLQLFVASFALANDDDKVIILHTNDVHTFMDSGISYAGVAAYKKQMQEKYGAKDVVMVDAGDIIQGGPVGALTTGSALIDLMNAVGYDYMTPGNHEFDYGMARLFELLKKLNTKVISCNITYLKDGKLLFAPYAIQEFHGLKVAFVGITTPESLLKSTPAHFQDNTGKYLYGFAEGGEDDNGKSLYAVVQKAVDEARAQGAEIVIALAHLGLDEESSPWRAPDVIKNTSGIDALIDGHSHTVVRDMKIKNKDGKDVIVTQTGTRLQTLGKITIDTKNKSLTAELIDKVDKKDPKVQEAIDSINADLAKTLERSVAKSDVTLISQGKDGKSLVRSQETNLGNFVADAFRIISESDVAIINGGSIRANIGKGEITFKNIIDVLPFGGDAVVKEVTGQDLLNALEMGASAYPKESGAFLHVSGMTYSIDTKIPSSVEEDSKGNFVSVGGEYRVKDVKIAGKPLELDKKYKVSGTNYMLQESGDGMTMLKDAKLLKDKFMVDNEILIAYLTKNLGGVVSDAYKNPEGQGRITILK